MRPDYLSLTPLGTGALLSSPENDVRVEFAPDTPRITYTVKSNQSPAKVVLPGHSKPTSTFTLRVNDRDDAVWLYDEQNIPCEVESVAQTMLDHLI